MSKSLSQKESKKSEEEWRNIAGYEGLYQVSNLGRVKSLERTVAGRNGSKRIIRGRILKPGSTQDGYLLVSLCNGSGKKKMLRVNRLVCEAFHENHKNKPQVNHINEDKSDNRACNLEWVTAKENCNHGTRNARMAKSVGQYTTNGKLIKIWQSTHEVERQLGFANQNISSVARGKLKTAYGYVWKYVEKEKKNI